MFYVSTRGLKERFSFSQAVVKGLAPDGGLFVPEEDVVFSKNELESLVNMNYYDLATEIIMKYAADFTREEISECVSGAYKGEKFPEGEPVKMTGLNPRLSVLELYHGPTCAFKDMALQLLPRIMVKAAKKCGETREIVILTATSGDTGKAALEGFRDVEGIKVMVFFPSEGVSRVQKMQMVTQKGNNVKVVAINGNFDDAQTGVKKIFSDKAFADRLSEKGVMLSSANSINWGRLLPQIVYYFYAYASLVRSGRIIMGEPVDFTVPTGNFGDILACYYAKKAGLPVGRIICASNINNVVAEFINTGVYLKDRKFITTSSPAMDILVSSNLERLLYHAAGRDGGYVAGLMSELSGRGHYSVSDGVLKNIQADFDSGFASEEETLDTVNYIYNKYNYLIDPHTAVGFKVRKTVHGSGNHNVCVSTASPFKFNMSVAGSIFGEKQLEGLTEFQVLDVLSEKTGIKVPGPLKDLDKCEIRFKEIINPCDMMSKVEEFINE